MAPEPVQKSNPSSPTEMRDCPASMRKTSRLWARAPRDSAADLSMPFPTTAQPEQYPPIAFRIILDAILPTASAAVNSATPPDRALLRFPAKGKHSPAFSSPIPQQYPAWPSPPRRFRIRHSPRTMETHLTQPASLTGKKRFSTPLFPSLQRNISTSSFFSGTGLTQSLRWNSSRVSVIRSCNDLNYICSTKHISAFLRRNHRFRPV